MASGSGNKGRGAKATSTLKVPRNVSVFPEEVQFSEEVDGDNVPKDAYLVLKRAFDDVKQRLISTRNHNAKLKEKNFVLSNIIKELEEKLEFLSSVAKENESLKEKVELSFIAFDEKYKESQNLRKKLEKVSKEEGNEQSEEQGEEQQDLIEHKVESITQSQTSVIFNKDIETVDSFTQTPEGKTDELSCVPSSTLKKLLKSCGLEIMVVNRKHHLLLIERDALKKWIENETDGKVSVAFEKTSVFERHVQTDLTNEQEHTEEYLERKNIVIHLKNKIVDQANSIKLCRDQITKLSETLRNTEAKKVPTASTSVQTEERVPNEQFSKNQIRLITRYNKPVLTALCLLKQKMVLLYKDLEYQKFYGRRLLQIINNSMDVPKNFVSSVLKIRHEIKSKTGKTQKLTVSRAYLEDEKLQDSTGFIYSPPESYAELPDPHLSLPVQETVTRLRIKTVKPKDSNKDASLDKEAISVASAGSWSLSSESSVSIVPAEESKTIYNSQTVMKDVRTQSSTSNSPRVEQSSGQEDSDDIEVIGEEVMGAAGGRSDIKECPLCFILFTSGTRQQEFEKHVMDHFNEDGE